MSGKEPKWIRNQSDDGDRPVCPYCDEPYGDGDIFDIKNYPDDGIGAVFFPCVNCEKESEITVSWEKIRKIIEVIK